jgi:ABC-type antimicrobial peptide transport system permease subunit
MRASASPRTRGSPARYAASARAALAKLDRSLLITNATTLDTIVEDAQTGPRLSLFLISILAAIAALLAGVGLYGVLRTVVRRRTAEIGVRVAPSGSFGLMIACGLRLSVAGIAAGLVSALLLTRSMTSMLAGIEPTDPLTFRSQDGVVDARRSRLLDAHTTDSRGRQTIYEAFVASFRSVVWLATALAVVSSSGATALIASRRRSEDDLTSCAL